jgi:hypothetical protein
MKKHLIIDRIILLSILLIGCPTVLGPGLLTTPAYGQEKMYQEFDGVMVFYKPVEVDTYRKLLPDVFEHVHR